MASTVHLCSGQIYFGDPTKFWDPSHFPNLPSTNLIITASGRVEDQSFSTMTFPNSLTYEPYEASTIRSTLSKTLEIDIKGNVSYVTPHLGFVSTYNTTYQTPISSFTTSAIAGANLSNADTVTNAIAKLDSWITNTFLLQPPCITPVESISTSLYGDVRWNNFNTYSILNTFAPYVTSIVFIIGDPTSPNFITLEWSGQDYFPFKQYVTGITPTSKTPLVKLRLFTDFFPKSGLKSYTKQTMGANCMTIVQESGNYKLPTRGKVFSIDDTNHIDSFTTFNLYIPNLPKDTDIPIRISYMNHTIPEPNVCTTSTIIWSSGEPSEPTVSVTSTTVKSMTYTITPPVYSDSLHLASSYFSSYTLNYTWDRFETVFSDTSGYIYGTPSIHQLPDFLSTYASTYSYSIPYFASTLIAPQMGIASAKFIPGSLFKTSVSATNNARLTGPPSLDTYGSTLFGTTSAPTLQAMPLIPNSQGVFGSNSLNTLAYTSDGWQISTTTLTNVFFLSSPTAIHLITSLPAQFNHSSYPGDRNPITVTTFHTDINENTRNFNIHMSTSANDYVLQSTYVGTTDGDSMRVTLSDTQSKLRYSHYFYNARIEAQPIISTISSTIQTVQLALQNTAVVLGQETQKTVSTAIYAFNTDAFGNFTYDTGVYTSTCSDVRFISGLPTASDNAKLFWNATTTFQLSEYAPSSFGYASLMREDTYVDQNGTTQSTFVTVGPITDLVSSIQIYNTDGTKVLATPWPSTTYYSSLTVNTNGNIFQDPVCPDQFFINTTFRAPYPVTSLSLMIPLTNKFYIDTISVVAMSKFQNETAVYGRRIQSFLPRPDIGIITSNDIYDGVSCSGLTSNGLDVQYSSFIVVSDSTISISTDLAYDNTVSLASVYPNTYSRELMMLQGSWLHPAEINFNTFDASLYGLTTPFPNFDYDSVYDVNQGFRYITFLYTPSISEPTVYNSLDVTINNASFIGALTTNVLTGNTFFPNSPVNPTYLQYSKVKLHVKHFATYYSYGCQKVETAWINGLKQDNPPFDDGVYDEGGCTSVSTTGSSITYSVSITPRYYIKIATLVRIGIAARRDYETGESLKFDNVTIQYKS